MLLPSGCGVHVHFHQTGSSGVGSLHTKPWSGALLAFDIGFRESRPSTGGTDAKRRRAAAARGIAMVCCLTDRA